MDKAKSALQRLNDRQADVDAREERASEQFKMATAKLAKADEIEAAALLREHAITKRERLMEEQKMDLEE